MKLERKYGKPMLSAVILVGVYLFFFDLFLLFKFNSSKFSAVAGLYESSGGGRMLIIYYTCFVILYFVVLFGLARWSRQKIYYVIVMIILLLAFLNWVFYFVFTGDILGDHFLQ